MYENVPVFLAHERKFDDETIVVDEKRLNRIFENTKRMENDRGVIPRGLLGSHSKKDAKPEDKPTIGSYYQFTHVGNYGKDEVPCIFARQFVCKGAMDEVKKYPFRSSEYYDGSDTIKAVAQLSDDPYFDMGMMLYGDDDNQVRVYKLRSIGESKEGEPRLYMAVTPNTPPVAGEGIGMGMSGAMSDPTLPPRNAGTTTLDEGIKAQIDAYMLQFLPQLAEQLGLGGASGMAAMGSAPGSPESYIPGFLGGDEGKANLPYSGDQPMTTPRQDDRAIEHQQELNALKAQLEESNKINRQLLYQSDESEARRELTQLKAEGKSVSIEQMLPQVMALPKEQRAGFYQMVRDNFKTDPAAPVTYGNDGQPVHMVQTEPNKVPEPGQGHYSSPVDRLTAEESEKCRNYALRLQAQGKMVSYEEAARELYPAKVL